MTTTKIITNTIYWLVLPALIIFDHNNFPLYFVVAGILIQAIIIISVYRISNRNIPGEARLENKHDPFNLKQLLLIIPGVMLLYLLQSLLLSALTWKHLVIYFSAGIISIIIQYLIESGKNIGVFIVEGDKLYVNDFFVKTYQLEDLAGIGYDGYSEVYIVRFVNNKRVNIKKDDYRQEDLDHFFAVMVSKSNENIELADSIRDEIMIAVKHGTLPA